MSATPPELSAIFCQSGMIAHDWKRERRQDLSDLKCPVCKHHYDESVLREDHPEPEELTCPGCRRRGMTVTLVHPPFYVRVCRRCGEVL